MDLRITEIFLSIQGESSHAGQTVRVCAADGLPDALRLVRLGIHFHGRERISFEDIFAAGKVRL